MTVAQPAARRTRNHLIWLGPLVTAAGVVSYFTFFARFPALRDFPWVNLPLTLLGVAMSLTALWRAFARSEIYRGKILGSIGGLFSLLFGGLLFFYVFSLSYQLPGTASVIAEQQVVPNFTLEDHTGKPFPLASLDGKRVVLVFYRGHW